MAEQGSENGPNPPYCLHFIHYACAVLVWCTSRLNQQSDLIGADKAVPFFFGPLQMMASSGLLSRKPTDITAKLSSTYWGGDSRAV